MSNPNRVLLVFGKLNRGGAETLAMNIFRKIDREKIIFDFAVHTDEHCDYDDEVEALGGKIYRFSRYNGVNHSHYVNEWETFFNEHSEYKIIHAHSTGSAAIYLKIAKEHGLITISHSHTVAPKKKGARQVAVNAFRHPLKNISDYLFACSEESGEWMFGEEAVLQPNYRTIKNGIDLEKFRFTEEKRISVRTELNIPDDAFVIGNVARFDEAKNHSYLLDVFNDVLKKEPDSRLVLVGTGALKDSIEKKAESLGIIDKIVFTGSRNDVDRVLCAFDVFMLPSVFEGVPLSVIEAQAAGLPVLATDVISDEVKCTDYLSFLSIKENPAVWADKALSYKGFKKEKNCSVKLAEHGYDINSTAKYLERFYLDLVNSNKAKRVLLVFGKMNRGGAETLAMNIFRNVDRNRLVFDFAVHTDEHCDYDDEIEELGGKIYRFSRYNVLNHFSYVNSWKLFFDAHSEYKVLHAHNTGSAAVIIPIAKKNGVYCISHSHIAKSQSGIRQKIVDLYQLPLRKSSDYLFACSDIAGKWLFGEDIDKKDNYKIIKNGVDTDEFRFNADYRNEIRNELSLSNSLVVINVSRFHIQKNHSFLIDVFYELQKIVPDSKLLLVGTGELEKEIKEKTGNLNISDKVIFTGVRSDVNKLLSAADVFCMPSFREGLPVSLVEAQAAGLPVVASDTISEEIKITDLVTFCSLEESPSAWAEIITDSVTTDRRDTSSEIMASGYDIKTTAKFLENFYLQKYE